jgi:hypothetical protein
MEYEVMYENKVNPNGKHQWWLWIQSMYAINVHAKEGEEHGKVQGNTAFEIDDYLWVVHENWCRVKPPLHWIDGYKKDKEHMVVEERTIWRILDKLLVGVMSEAKRGPMD